MISKTIWKIVGWVISVFLFLLVLGSFIDKYFISGFLYLIGAIITNPICISLIEKYTHFSLKKWIIGVTASVVFIAGASTTPTSEQSPSSVTNVEESQSELTENLNTTAEQNQQAAPAEEAIKQAELEKKQAEEAAKQAELEKKQAEDAAKQAELEKKKAEETKKAEAAKKAEVKSTPVVEPKDAYATNTVNIREQPNTSCTVLGKVQQGQKVSVVGEEADWSRISYNGIDGYIKSEYLSENKPVAREPVVSTPAPVPAPVTQQSSTTSAASSTSNAITSNSNAASSSNNVAQPNNNASGRMVYIAPESGARYHYSRDCRGLKKANSIIEVTIEEAKSQGKSLCGYED